MIYNIIEELHGWHSKQSKTNKYINSLSWSKTNTHSKNMSYDNAWSICSDYYWSQHSKTELPKDIQRFHKIKDITE